MNLRALILYMLSFMFVQGYMLSLQAAESYRLESISFSQLPNWQQEKSLEVITPLKTSCQTILRQKKIPDMSEQISALVKMTNWQSVCQDIVKTNFTQHEQARAFIETRFTPYQVVQKSSKDLEAFVTGYYEPIVEGSYEKSGAYQTPLYPMPSDVKADQKYYTRQEIQQGALRHHVKPILFLNDPIDAFFMQVQGSGLVRLDNAKVVRLGFAGKNGHDYTSIGKYLIEQGEMKKEEVTLKTLKQWLRDHPDRVQDVFAQNKSYIFFKPITGMHPKGAQGVELTPQRSLAVDPYYIPFGSLVYVDIPSVQYKDHFPRTMVAQDAGSAIKGPQRADVFWGHGHEAEIMAGPMKDEGRFYLLLPN